MAFFLYNFFHNKTNEKSEKELLPIPKNIDEWPESWKKIIYKNYCLFKPIVFGREDGPFLKLLQTRLSSEGCILGNIVTLEKIAYILKCGYGLQDISKNTARPENRTVPSAGRIYPLEVYVFFFNNHKGISSGVYHYGIKNNILEPVILTKFSNEKIKSFCSQNAVKGAQGIFCITSVFNRSTEKYGSRAYRYILLEAGHVAQNILLAGAERNFNSIPIGGANESVLEETMGLGSSYERIVYTLFF